MIETIDELMTATAPQRGGPEEIDCSAATPAEIAAATASARSDAVQLLPAQRCAAPATSGQGGPS